MQVNKLNNILVNIGRPMLTEAELDALCHEAGTNDRSIPLDKMVLLL